MVRQIKYFHALIVTEVCRWLDSFAAGLHEFVTHEKLIAEFEAQLKASNDEIAATLERELQDEE